MMHARTARRPLVRVASSIALAVVLSSCGKAADDSPPRGEAGGDSAVFTAADLVLETCAPSFDSAAGDPSVPAELGGPGFTGEGWQTATEYPIVGDPAARKGGTVRQVIYDWPATLRQCGQGWNDYVNYIISGLCYESLISVHPVTLEFIPSLATHWQIADDQMTYRFRINPAARWSDGHEVTAEDVVATIRLKTDPGIQDPSAAFTLGKMEKPRAISKYIVEVKVKDRNWRNFLYFGGTSIFPAHEIGKIDGKTYLDEYQFKYTAASGPYEVLPDDIEKGVAITLTRRDDYWGKNECFAQGRGNIDKIKLVVVKDENLAFEKFKKGEIDIFQIPKAQWWAEEMDKIDGIQRGLIQKRKVFTDAPIGVSGIAVNTRRPPLDDLRVRQALCHLLNRELMIEKLYFNEYMVQYSAYQGGIYQNPDNKPIPYDPSQAVSLLAEAGWTERGADGILVKDGKRLEFEIQYESKLTERSLTILQEDCRRAGIQLDLQLLNRSTRWKNMMDRKFELTTIAWGGLVFPNPESSFHSRLADLNDNNNITGFKNARVDELCSQYDLAFDINERISIIREIDGLVYNQQHYIMEWYLPSQRFAYWNKFGQPRWYLSRIEDIDQILYSWWVDPEKEKVVEAGKTDPNVTMPKGPTEIHFWEAYKRATEKATAAL